MKVDTSHYDLIVIGGGAAGLMAAIAGAKILGPSKVAVLERSQSIGRKILATGNGRCNFSNGDIQANYYNQPNLVERVFTQVPPKQTLRIFEEMGLMYRWEEQRLYPYSNMAKSVLEVLQLELESLQIQVVPDFLVTKIISKGTHFLLQAIEGAQVTAARLVVATGGMASPQLGTDGRGYELMTSIGHRITSIKPGLIGLVCPEKHRGSLSLKLLDGLRVQANASLYKFTDHTKKRVLLDREKGEVLFRKYGLSGIAIFQLSRIAQEGEIHLDLFPEHSITQLISLLKQRRSKAGAFKTEVFLNGMLHSRVSQAVLKSAGIKAQGDIYQLKDQDLQAIAEVLKAWVFPIEGSNGWQQAQVTLGGLSLSQFDSRTLASKVVPGLYAAGEILDVDGPCGGYNLQWAWSSGWLAGESAALSLNIV